MKNSKYGQYDESSKTSIFKHAQILLNKSLIDLYKEEIGDLPREYFNPQKKGSLGCLVEKLHFNYEPNERPEPDFESAKLELKTTPLKIVKNKFVSKERLVLGMIDYFKIDKEIFENSSFLKKNSSLLLLFYLYEKNKIVEQVFKIIKLWEIPKKDIPIIKKDWEIIHQKISDGKAHEISGGDTFYLEAARKGAGGGKDLRNQPKSDIKANSRALAFKSKYVNIILEGEQGLEKALDEDFTTSALSIEDYIIKKFSPHIGKTIEDISKEYSLDYSPNKKDLAASVSKAILGIKQGNRIEEFEKANITIKTITLNINGKPNESMSFKQINYDEILNEKWLESEFYNEVVNSKYFFVIFKEDSVGIKHLNRVLFWFMPKEMRKQAKDYWLDIKEKTQNRNFDYFWKISDKKTFHVRPKARVASDTTTLRDGTIAKKMAYWINRDVIYEIISNGQTN